MRCSNDEDTQVLYCLKSLESIKYFLLKYFIGIMEGSGKIAGNWDEKENSLMKKRQTYEFTKKFSMENL